MSEWKKICLVTDIPVLGSRRVSRTQGIDVAVFRNDADVVFALLDRCPHKGGPLSQGIVFGESVACPLHNWTIDLNGGCAKAPDEGCTPKFALAHPQAQRVTGALTCKFHTLHDAPDNSFVMRQPIHD